MPIDPEQPIPGVMIAEISSLGDAENPGRVKVTFPSLENLQSDWIEVMAIGAGKSRGLFWMPEVGDQVLVAFLEGDFLRPYVIGGLWNGQDKAPIEIKEGKNDVRQLTSRTGHTVTLTDTDKAQSLSLKSQGGHVVTLDDAEKSPKLTVTSKAGHSLVLDDASGKEKVALTSKSGHSVTLDDASGAETITIQDKSGHQIVLKSTGEILIKSAQDLKIDASGSVILAGGSLGAARMNDPTVSNAASDSAFWQWVMAVATHTHPTTAPGSPTGPPVLTAPSPVECKGSISQASSKVKIG